MAKVPQNHRKHINSLAKSSSLFWHSGRSDSMCSRTLVSVYEEKNRINHTLISPISTKVPIYKRFSRITILYKGVVLWHLKAKMQFFSSFFGRFLEMASTSQKVVMKIYFLHKPCIYARDARLTSSWFSYIIAVQTVLVLLATLTH